MQKNESVLEPVDRVSEVLFGLIMALAFPFSANAIAVSAPTMQTLRIPMTQGRIPTRRAKA
jgi:hypothetical protein